MPRNTGQSAAKKAPTKEQKTFNIATAVKPSKAPISLKGGMSDPFQQIEQLEAELNRERSEKFQIQKDLEAAVRRCDLTNDAYIRAKKRLASLEAAQ